MPLVRIDVIEGRWDTDRISQLAQTVQDVLVDEFAAPERDRYQVISEHKPGHIVALDTGLGFERSDDVVVIQVTQQGRSTDQKKALYAALSVRLEASVDLNPKDLVVSVVENTQADWSFGFGRAQFLEGDL
ncbi:putative tautomerase YolI [Rhodococcoides trifolii]|uniref:Tautomerase YolI n=1 Tax=Rhodococcoides trifolii TaxID=908250 RepID=A0A917CQI5_9NOCA|nr:tautomerase family protein [Rhodococcus trifolii]GGF93943.1 putative tautomerase YolI [Rhodococcus trifolii]